MLLLQSWFHSSIRSMEVPFSLWRSFFSLFPACSLDVAAITPIEHSLAGFVLMNPHQRRRSSEHSFIQTQRPSAGRSATPLTSHAFFPSYTLFLLSLFFGSATIEVPYTFVFPRVISLWPPRRCTVPLGPRPVNLSCPSVRHCPSLPSFWSTTPMSFSCRFLFSSAA